MSNSPPPPSAGQEEEHERLLPSSSSSSAGPSNLHHRHQHQRRRSIDDEDSDCSQGPDSDPASRSSKMYRGTRLGTIRAYWLGVVVCMGGFLFGYDSGIVGGVLTLDSFMSDFGYGDSQSTKTSSFAVSLQQLGAFVSCFFVWPVTHRLGRRKSLMISSVVFCIGVIIQTCNTGSLSAFYVSRVIAGLGLGSATVVVPMFSSEMAPKELRGQIGCFFQLFFTLGIFTSYWVDYGVSQNISSSLSKQWQIPIGLQLLPAGILGFGTLTLKESVRWYVRRGEYDKAWESLKWIRASEAPEVHEEMQEIRVGVEIEIKEKEGFTFRELLLMPNLKRLTTAFLVFLAQQATGATAFAYYSPQYFQLLVGKSGTRALLLSGIFGAVKVIACATFVFLLADRVGRRITLIIGAVAMAVVQIITAAIVQTHPPPSEDNAQVTSSGIATVAMIYLFVMIYNFSWGALPWPYVSEIFPTRIREPGVGVGVASQWLFNFVFTLATPYMIKSMGWGTFLFWGLANVVIASYAWGFLKETRGLALEEITAQMDGREDMLHQKTGEGESEDGGVWSGKNGTHDTTKGTADGRTSMQNV